MEQKIIAIIIATLNPDGKEAMDHYMKEMNSLYAFYKVKSLNRFPVHEVFIGDKKPDFVAILEFADEQTFNAVFDTANYQKLVPFRDKAFTSLQLYKSRLSQ